MPGTQLSFTENLKLLLEYRELLWNFAHREITQRYKQSVLGHAWVLLNPLFQMIVVSFVFSLILRVPSLGSPYIIFLSIGLLPWNFFLNSLTSSANVLVSNSNLITKIYFPREILVYATIIAKSIDFFYSCIVLIVFFLIFKTPIASTIIFVPLILLIQFMLTIGLSLLAATFNLFYRDIQYIINLLLILWIYMTPIMYPMEIIPMKYRIIFTLNPMAAIVNTYRVLILGTGTIDITGLWIAFLVSLFVFIVGYIVFKNYEGRFADYV